MKRRIPKRVSSLLLIFVTLLVTSACTVSTSLTPAMPEESGRIGVESEVRQPFYADSEGLHKLTVRFFPDGFPGSQVPVEPSRGARIELNYSPGDDPRFPQTAFHEWPEHHEWLSELAGDVVYEQTFCTPYPDLSGIEVRVATYSGDVSAGTGVLKPFETVEVRRLPVVGQHMGFMPGGSEVEVTGSAEGWARVILGDNQRGWINMEHFAELPEPHRTNDQDVILELYELQGDEPIRASVVNAADMFDISHQSFEFRRVEDSLDQCYRFVVTSPDSYPGNAITFRLDPEGSYVDGRAMLNGDELGGDIVFRPLHNLRTPLYSGNLDDYEWAAPLDAFEARFDPVPNTADRYLEVRVRAGDATVNVPWAQNRPPGQRPLEVIGDPEAPAGGLIFNAAFQHDIPVTEVSRVTARDLYSRARMDTLFFAGLTILLTGTVLLAGIVWRKGRGNGR